MTDDELKALVASLSVAHKEMLASNAASKKELDLQLAKTDAQIAKTNAQLAKTDSQIAKTDTQIARIEAQQEKTDQRLDRIAELVGNNQGDIAEEFFYTSFAKKPNLGDIHFDSLNRNFIGRIGNLQEGYDLLLVNDDTLAVIEIKSKAHVSDMEKLVNRKIPNFKKLFKVYKDFHCYAGIATLVTNPDLIEKAKELGLFLVTQQGDHASLVQTGRLLH